MHADLLSYLATVEPSQAWLNGIAALIPALISVLGMIKGNGAGTTTGAGTGGVTTETTDTNMMAILSLMRQRTEMQNPLYEAVTRLAMGLMPTAYQTGNNYPWTQGFNSTIGGGDNGAHNGPGGGNGGGSDSNGYPIPGGGGGTNEGTPDPQPFGGNPWDLVDVGAPANPLTPVRPWSPEGLRRPIVRPIGRQY